uniref:FAD/NAD(P)-binding domain-containing protein n=1 Tax=Mycena chlorophos TaxID=658473 RepID=A0ABQ0MDB9_MYCCL|nr:FAD/NAD(P)-binding domain-containing protein [Mycena chlorophos]
MSSKTSRIVVVGGGSGGAMAAKQIAAKLPSGNVTLINPLPFIVVRPTLARMTVSANNDLLETAMIPYDKLFSGPNGTFVQGVVHEIKPAKSKKGGVVVLEDGKEIQYDILVLAPGSHWDGPLDVPDEDAETFVKEQRAKFSKASKIVLVGGGSVSIEFAGEIKDEWPNKEVTIVHSGASLLNDTYTDRFRKSLDASLRVRGVNLILNDYVDEIPTDGSAVRTRNGHTIEADLVVATKGPRPRTGFVAKSLGESAVDSRGQIKVDPTFQLPGHPTIFAIGDAINAVEQKQAAKAGAHAGIVAANVVALVSGSKLKEYKGSTEMILITNGRNGGRAYFGFLWGLVFGDWFARTLKSKTLMVPMSRSAMGY